MDQSHSEEITLQLSSDEAIVLDSLLGRFDAGEERTDALPIQHPAERANLWGLQAALERALGTPFEPNYDRLLAGARMRVREKAGL